MINILISLWRFLRESLEKFQRIFKGTPERVSGGMLEKISVKWQDDIYGGITDIPAGVFQ